MYVLFIITRTWKQPRCPSADEWIRKLWYIYTMEYYSAIKKNTFESVLLRWMKLELIIQSEVSQKKNTNTVYWHIYTEFRKMVMMTLYARQQKRHRCIEQTFGLWGRGEGGMIRENDIETCILSCKKRSASLCSIQDIGCLGLVHGDDPEKWHGVEGERGSQDLELIYTHGWFMSMYDKTTTVL